MMKRLLPVILALAVLACSFGGVAFACDENQTDAYVCQILFGDNAPLLNRSSNEEVEMLLNALYLCSEQADGFGQDKIAYLKEKRVSAVPALKALDIKGDDLLECSHNTWEYEYQTLRKAQSNRKKVLRNTVNKVFDFGLINNLFGSGSGQCESFSAVLFYSHLLADYLADDPAETEVVVGGKLTPAYSGEAFVEVNGDRPSFTESQKKSTDSFVKYSGLDGLGRAGVVFANIGPDTIAAVGPRKNMTGIKPSGWRFDRYDGIVNSRPPYVYNRCHLLAHSLGGLDQEINLVTGTRYMNQSGMEKLEKMVSSHIKKTGNHVLYRVTPVFQGSNKLASGVQIEAYSVEDAGTLKFNKFCYNVQPGIDLNYANGDTAVSDMTFGVENVLPFAVYNADEDNPDLIFEVDKHLEILFESQKNSEAYTSMRSGISAIAAEARAALGKGNSPAKDYTLLKEYEYEYFKELRTYVPALLRKEKFFTSAFK